MDYELREERIFLEDTFEKEALELFLNNEGIRLDKNLDYTLGIYHKDELIATGSFFKNTLRCLAVKKEYQGLGIMNKVVSHLMNELYYRGYTSMFLYTKGSAAKSFMDMGFYEIERVDDSLVFMENRSRGIKEYVEKLSLKKVWGNRIAAIVMNANPFTLGHQSLVEKAALENDVVHVFVVSEEASVTPFFTRYHLVKQGTSHLKNVILHETGDYVISNASFPSYFIKEEESVVELHAKLDLKIFCNYIAPALGIKKRYIGEEPYDEVTRTYNRVMKEELEKQGIQCNIIPRRRESGTAISASKVRQFIREDRLEEIKKLVPITTYNYFKSEDAKALIERIKKNYTRH